jgi:hypothetical protein
VGIPPWRNDRVNSVVRTGYFATTSVVSHPSG